MQTDFLYQLGFPEFAVHEDHVAVFIEFCTAQAEFIGGPWHPAGVNVFGPCEGCYYGLPAASFALQLACGEGIFQ